MDLYLGVIIIDTEVTRVGVNKNDAEISALVVEAAPTWQQASAMSIGTHLFLFIMLCSSMM